MHVDERKQARIDAIEGTWWQIQNQQGNIMWSRKDALKRSSTEK